MADIQQDNEIKKNIAKYKKIFKNIPQDKKMFIEKLYIEAAFMEATLNDLKDKIKNEGAVITSKNGNGFDVTQEHPAQKSYNITIRNYNGIMKSLIEYIPEENQNDELTTWLKR